MLRFILCLMLCLSLPGPSAWAAWRVAAVDDGSVSTVSHTPLSTPAADAPMPCHGDSAALAPADADDTRGSTSSTCPHCGFCGACLLTHALPSDSTSLSLRAAPQAAPAQPNPARVAPFATAGPDRPPRAR